MDQQVGDWECKSGTGGVGNYFSCGTVYVAVSSWTQNNQNGTPKTIHGAKTHFNACWPVQDLCGGDSGATILYNHHIFGIGNRGDGGYSHVQDIQDDNGLLWCLNSGCT